MKVETHFSGIFRELTDHRVNRTKLHSLENIIFISMTAIISGSETWNEIEEFGKGRIDWFSKYLDLPNGIPSHDTFNRFFSNLDPDKFESVFRKWVSSFGRECKGDVISIDGKSIRGSRRTNQLAIHMVSAWSKNAGITLGQLRTPDKGSELKAIPELLDALFIKGSIVTIDALGAQPNIAEKIIDNGADYILQIKKNRKNMVKDIEIAFHMMKPSSVSKTIDNAHGRMEMRKVSVIKGDGRIRKSEQWKNLQSIVMIESQSVNKVTGEMDKSTAYYITSLDSDAETIGKAIRSHWGIENSLHWMLDVAFSEDRGRKTNQNAVINFSLMNKIALDFLKKEKSMKTGIKSKRMKAGWSTSYLEKVLNLS